MASFCVADIVPGGVDASGARIRAIYAKYPPFYAVYATDDRVSVQFSDLADIESAQRAAVSKLNPLRGEINYLVDGWRTSRRRMKQAKLCDRRVADALIMACEGDPAGALTILQMTRDEIVGQRTSRARFYYLIVASMNAFIVTTAIWATKFDWFSDNIYQLPDQAHNIILGAAAGTQGAFFSIAIAIRQRTVLPDIYMLSNAADAVLRIFIGLMGAALLVCMLEARLVAFGLGGQPIDLISGTASTPAWLTVLAIGFVAGFSERLVPDLLDRATVVGRPADGAAPAKGEGAAKSAPVTTPGAAANDPGPAVRAVATASNDDDDAEDDADACLCADGARDHEATPDTALPAARGGVAGGR